MKATRKDGKRSIRLGFDNNPDVTKADFLPAEAAKNMPKANLGLKFKVKKKKKMAAKGLANEVGATAAKGMKYMGGGKYKMPMAGKGMKYAKKGMKHKTAGKGMKYGK